MELNLAKGLFLTHICLLTYSSQVHVRLEWNSNCLELARKLYVFVWKMWQSKV